MAICAAWNGWRSTHRERWVWGRPGTGSGEVATRRRDSASPPGVPAAATAGRGRLPPGDMSQGLSSLGRLPSELGDMEPAPTPNTLFSYFFSDLEKLNGSRILLCTVYAHVMVLSLKV